MKNQEDSLLHVADKPGVVGRQQETSEDLNQRAAPATVEATGFSREGASFDAPEQRRERDDGTAWRAIDELAAYDLAIVHGQEVSDTTKSALFMDDSQKIVLNEPEGSKRNGWLTAGRREMAHMDEIMTTLVGSALEDGSDVRAIRDQVNVYATTMYQDFISPLGHKRLDKRRADLREVIADRQIRLLDMLASAGNGEARDAKAAVELSQTVRNHPELGVDSSSSFEDAQNGVKVKPSRVVLSDAVEQIMSVRPHYSKANSEASFEGMMKREYEQATSTGVDRQTVSEKGVYVGQRLYRLRGMAQGLGVDMHQFPLDVAEHLSPDHEDFLIILQDMIEEIPQGSDSLVMREDILRASVRSFVANGHSERSKKFTYEQQLSDTVGEFRMRSMREVAMYEVNLPSRLLKDSIGLFELISQHEHMETEKRIIALNAVDALDEYRGGRKNSGAIDVDDIQSIIVIVETALIGTERARALSQVVATYELLETKGKDVQKVLGFRDIFVPSIGEDGMLHENQVRELRDFDMLSSRIEVTSPQDADVIRFCIADMIVSYISQAIAGSADYELSKMRELLESLPHSRQTITAMLEVRSTVVAERVAYLSRVDAASDENVDRYTRFVLKQFGPQAFRASSVHDALARIDSETERVRDSLGVSINISADSLAEVLFEPPYRLKSGFEVRNRKAAYDMVRSSKESAMGIRTASDMLIDEHPIYGSVTSPNGRDEVLGGAPGGFGSIAVSLKYDRVKDRGVVIPRDSFYDPTKDMPSMLRNAAEIVAVNNIINEKYAEVQIMGGVTVSDIDSVTIDAREAERNTPFLRKLSQMYPDIVVRIVNHSDAATRKSDPTIVDAM